MMIHMRGMQVGYGRQEAGRLLQAILRTARTTSQIVGAALASVSAMLDAPDQGDLPLDKLPPHLTAFALTVEKAIHITTSEPVGFLLLIVVCLLLMIFLLHALDRK